MSSRTNPFLQRLADVTKALPFTVLADIDSGKSKMVDIAPETWNQMLDTLEDWAVIFQQREHTNYSEYA